jgi:hypothetical protein
MSLIAVLDIALRGDMSALNSALAQSKNQIQQFSISIKQGSGDILSSLLGLQSGAGKAVGGVAAALRTISMVAKEVAGSLKDLFQDGVESMFNLARSAERLGVTTSALAGLQHAAVLAGMPVGDLARHLSRMQKAISSAAMGKGDTTLVALRQLNISAKELMDLPLEQQTEKLARGIMSVGNAADRARMMTAFMDRSATRMIPVFEVINKMGAQGLSDRASTLGPTAGEHVKEVETMRRAWLELQQIWKGLGRTVAVALAPVISEVAPVVDSIATAIAGFFSENVTLIQEGLKAVFMFVRALLQIGWAILKSGSALVLWPAMLKGLSALFDMLGLSMSDWKELTLAFFAAVQFGALNWQRLFGVAVDWAKLKLMEFVNAFVDAMSALPRAIQAMLKFDGARIGALKLSVGADMRKLEADFIKFGKELIADAMRKREDKWDGPGSPLLSTAKKPAAMEFGSKEAFSVMTRTQTQQDKMLNFANDQLREQKKMARFLDKIARFKFGLKRAKL